MQWVKSGAKEHKTWEYRQMQFRWLALAVFISGIGELSLQFPIYWRAVGDPRSLWRNDYCANDLELSTAVRDHVRSTVANR